MGGQQPRPRVAHRAPRRSAGRAFLRRAGRAQPLIGHPRSSPQRRPQQRPIPRVVAGGTRAPVAGPFEGRVLAEQLPPARRPIPLGRGRLQRPRDKVPRARAARAPTRFAKGAPPFPQRALIGPARDAEADLARFVRGATCPIRQRDTAAGEGGEEAAEIDRGIAAVLRGGAWIKGGGLMKARVQAERFAQRQRRQWSAVAAGLGGGPQFQIEAAWPPRILGAHPGDRPAPAKSVHPKVKRSARGS